MDSEDKKKIIGGHIKKFLEENREMFTFSDPEYEVEVVKDDSKIILRLKESPKD